MQGSLSTYTYITVQHYYVSYAQHSMFYVLIKLSDQNKCEFYLIPTGKIIRIAINMISSSAMRIMPKSSMP